VSQYPWGLPINVFTHPRAWPGSFTGCDLTLGLDTRKCLPRKGNLDLSRVQMTQRERHFAGEAYDVVGRVVRIC
jgi:hypothetical protein